MALVAVGSNVESQRGLPKKTVCAAIENVATRAKGDVKVSRLYRTPAFPAESGPDFVNAVFSLEWPGTAHDLLRLLHEVEEAFGRVRRTRWEARVLDLDLLALGDQVLPDPAGFEAWQNLPAEEAGRRAPDELILPHPRLQDRGFVLVPLADIAPAWTHPVSGLTVREMLAALPAEELAEITPLDGD